MEKGILDFVAHNQKSLANKNESMFLDKMNDSQQEEANSFLKLAEHKKKQDSFNLDDSNIDEVLNDEALHDNYYKLVNDISNPLNLPNASLNFEHVKPADRATYLLNYLYM